MASTAVSYKCPSCDAPLAFTPKNGKVTCEYCGTEFEADVIEQLFSKKEEDAAKQQAAEDAKWERRAESGEYSQDEIDAMRVFTCSSCGAELVADDNTMATECCYCGNPTMLPSRFTGDIRPDFIIPFKLTKKDAVAKLKEFYKGKDLLPDAFTANNRVEDIQGMFVPFWLFDTTANASAVYNATSDAVVTTSDEIITTTSHYRLDRSATMAFERVPADGSNRMQDEYMDSIEPFNYDEMVPFSSQYMAGYLADKYDVTAESVEPRITQRIESTCCDMLSGTTGGWDSCEEENHFVIKENGTISYAMVPVWILTTRYQDKPYTFMMNGQTGKMVGALPTDEDKKSSFFRKDFLMAAAISGVLIGSLAWMIGSI